MSMRAFEERPILGWGPEIFSFVFDKHFIQGYPGLGSDETAIFFDRPHNKLWEVAVASGAVGFASYILMFLAILYFIFRHFRANKNIQNKERLLSVVLLSFFVASFVQNIFAFDNIATYILFFIVAGFINNNFSVTRPGDKEIMTESRKTEKPGKYSDRIKIALCIIATVLTVIIFYKLNVKPTLAGMDFASNIQYEGLHPEVALQGYKKGISRNTLYDKDLTVTFIDRMLFLLGNGAAKPIEGDVMKSLLDLKPALDRYLAEDDQNKKFLYGDGVTLNEHLYLYYKDKKYLDGMEQVARDAIDFNPNFPTFYQFLGTAEILKGNDQAGEDYMKKSYDIIQIKTIDDEFKYLYETGAAYLKRGDIKKAIDKFELALDADIKYKKQTGQSVTLVDPGMFVDSLAITAANNGDLKRCKEIYEKGIDAYPEYEQVFRQHLQSITQQMNKK
jgi:tetratricopeptide (TPR) repeat protein